MDFQPASYQVPAGQLFEGPAQFQVQRPNIGYQVEAFNFLTEPLVNYQSLEHDYAILPPTTDDHNHPQPPHNGEDSMKRLSLEIGNALNEINKGIFFLQAKCDAIEVTLSELQEKYLLLPP